MKMSEDDNNAKPSGSKELRKQEKKSTEELQIITNASVDVDTRTSTSTGGENPNLEKLNPADHFKPSQRLVTQDGQEI
jgi:hypothetical protein